MVHVVLLLLTALPLAHATNANFEQMRLLATNENSRAAPCQDFYEFACGNWRGHERFGDVTVLEQLDRNVNEQFVELLEQSTPTDPVTQLARDFYEACRELKTHTAWPYLRWLTREEGVRWPSGLPIERRQNVSSHTPADTGDWPWLLGVLRCYGLNGVLVEETILPREQNRFKWQLLIDMPSDLAFQRLSTMDFARIVIFFELKHFDATALQRLWRQIRQFETQLTALIAKETAVKALKQDDAASDENSIPDIDDDGQELLNAKQRGLPWVQRFLDTMLEHMDGRVGRSVTSNVDSVRYLESLTGLLNVTSNELICDYLMIRFAWHLLNSAPVSFEAHDCVANTRTMLPHAMAYLYERQHPQLANERKQVTRIFNALKRTFRRTLAANENQLGREELNYFLGKLEKMRLNLGNLPQTQTLERLKTHYASLLASQDDAPVASIPKHFFGQHLRAMRHTMRSFHEQAIANRAENENATKPETETETEINAAAEADIEDYFYVHEPQGDIDAKSSTPFFLQRANLIVLPLTLLNWPLYHRDHHDIFKFSSLGFMLAHELSHGFDLSGIFYDERGNAANARLLAQIRSNAHLETRIECLSARNATLWLDEKIADSTGLRIAYDTYFGTLRSATEQPEWLPNSIFIRNFAQFFCYTSDNDIDTSVHGGNRQRVLDAVARLPDFASVFQCANAPSKDQQQPRCHRLGRSRQRRQQQQQQTSECCELWS